MKKLFMLLFLSISSSNCFGWGKLGHQIIAQIAQDNLSEQTKEKVRVILGQDILDLPLLSNWADNEVFWHKQTARWHYINLPIREDNPDIEKYCPFDECVVGRIKREMAVLKGDKFGDKNKSLKYLIHLVGDIHQPLHCADDNDRGGNDKTVIFKGKKMYLHQLWDNTVTKYGNGDFRKEAAAIQKHFKRKDLKDSSVEEWAKISYEYAKYVIYSDLKKTTVLDDDYQKKMRPIALRQLGRAGQRLAFVLEECLK